MSEIDKATWDRAIEAMRHAGREAGLSAAEWWEQDNIGGRTSGDTREVAQRVMVGIDDGDPEILDGLPWLDLSGQWADGPQLEEIYGDAMGSELRQMPGWEEMGDGRHELIDAYRDAYDERVRERIEEMCAAHIDNAIPEENFGEASLTDRERNA